MAKSTFRLHGADAHGETAFQKRVTRAEVRKTIAQLLPCLSGRETWGSTQYWARESQLLGYAAKLISPQLMKPYVKGNKKEVRSALGLRVVSHLLFQRRRLFVL